MNISDSLEKSMNAYFQNAIPSQENLIQIFKIFQDFQDRKQKNMILDRIFHILQTITSKQNIKIVYKRYLYLITELLIKENIFTSKLNYAEILSKKLPTQFLFILKGALTHGTDLLMQIKSQRKRWAKLITDEAFDEMRQLGLRECRFDVDKGFPKDQEAKVLKDYKKRKFTAAQMERYMPSKPKEYSDAPRSKSSSSEQEISKPVKKVKHSRPPIEEDRPSEIKIDSMTPHSSFNSSSFPNGRLVHPIDPRQSYPNSFPLAYQNPAYQPPIYLNQPPQLPSYYGQNQAYTAGYPQYQQYPMGFGATVEPIRKGTQLFNSMQELRNKLRNSKCYECKFCGLLFSTFQKHQTHMQLHFLGAQKQFQLSHSRRDHARKALMPTTEEWLESRKSKTQSAVKLLVPVKGGSLKNQLHCEICQGELKVSWSAQLDSWVFEDAMRVCFGKKETQVCHEYCYNTIIQSND